VLHWGRALMCLRDLYAGEMCEEHIFALYQFFTSTVNGMAGMASHD